MRIPHLSASQAQMLESLVASIIEKQKAESHCAYWLDEGPQIDALVYGLYGLDAVAIREIELWYCRRYPRLARAPRTRIVKELLSPTATSMLKSGGAGRGLYPHC